MIAVDTCILTRFYIDDPADREAAAQSRRARRVMLESAAIFVPLTVVLELERVMRGFYRLEPESFCSAVNHLLGMAHVTVQHWEAISDAVAPACAAARLCGRVALEAECRLRAAGELRRPQVRAPGAPAGGAARIGSARARTAGKLSLGGGRQGVAVLGRRSTGRIANVRFRP